MAEIPEGAATAAGEGADLVTAIEGVAKELEISPEEVAYKLDLAHFRSGLGISMAKQTVRIIGWKGDKKKALPKASDNSGEREERPRRDRDDRRSGGRDDDRRGGDRDDRRGGDRDDRRGGDRDDRRGGDRDDRRSRDRDDRRGRDRDDRRGRDRDDRRDGERRERKARSQEPMEGEPTEASKFAVEWFSTLLGFMDVTGTVTGIGNDERVRVTIEADKAGRIIGKRGSTLRAIRQVLGTALNVKFGDLIIDVDVADNRPEGERRERNDRRDDRRRGDRGDRNDRNDRGDRDDRRGRGRRDSEASGHPPAKLEALAKRAAEKAIEAQKTITINLELNSYDRRIVHMAVAEIDGVDSRSEERDGKKFIQVVPAE